MDENIRKRIMEYIQASGKSQSKVAQEIGVSSPMLSQYLSGKYPNPEAVEGKAEEFFEGSHYCQSTGVRSYLYFQRGLRHY